MEKESIYGQMEMNMKGILLMGNLKVLELKKRMEKYMKDILRMIYMKEKEKKYIQMERNMKGIFMRDYLMEMEYGIILIIVNQKPFGKKEKKMVKRKKLWKMEIFMKLFIKMEIKLMLNLCPINMH